ncbi:hypothetical protein LXL04_012272 [Taraxacum kok-saghyz]
MSLLVSHNPTSSSRTRPPPPPPPQQPLPPCFTALPLIPYLSQSVPEESNRHSFGVPQTFIRCSSNNPPTATTTTTATSSMIQRRRRIRLSIRAGSLIRHVTSDFGFGFGYLVAYSRSEQGAGAGMEQGAGGAASDRSCVDRLEYETMLIDNDHIDIGLLYNSDSEWRVETQEMDKFQQKCVLKILEHAEIPERVGMLHCKPQDISIKLDASAPPVKDRTAYRSLAGFRLKFLKLKMEFIFMDFVVWVKIDLRIERMCLPEEFVPEMMTKMEVKSTSINCYWQLDKLPKTARKQPLTAKI